MRLLTLALLGCTEVGINTDIDPPTVTLVQPVSDGTFDPEVPVQVCAAIDTEHALDSLDLVLVSDVGGPLATEGFTSCAGGDLGITVTLPDAEQVLSLTATAENGQSGSASARVTPVPNTPPRCEVLFPAPDAVFEVGETVELRLRVEDDQSSALAVTVDSNLQGSLVVAEEAADSTVAYALDLDVGDHDLVVLVEDGRGANAICLASVEVIACVDTDGDGVDTCSGDCDDTDASSLPGADERPDGRDNDCDGTVDEGTVLFDDDGDGLNELEGDCDDTAADVNPGATETPDDGVDQDCTGADAITCFEDLDNDGHGGPTTAVDPFGQCGAGLSLTSTDCDDTNASRNPSAAEVPGDGIDQDCDGVDVAGCFEDLDGDGFGSPTVLPPGDGDCDDPGESAFGTDCNDANADVFPGGTEVNDDGIDQDCSGADQVTCFVDVDLDGFAGPTTMDEEGLCTVGFDESDDCDDLADSIFPGAPETADDGIDQDCSGTDSITCFVDADFDGFGDLLTVVADDGTCDTADNESTTSDDCDDASGAVYPGAPELVADGIDQDCDGVDSLDCFEDLDGDGWGTDATVVSVDGDCDDPGEAAQNGDCDDAAADRNPGETDVPDDAVDQDCSGADAITCFVDADGDGFGTSDTLTALDGTCDASQGESAVSTDCDDTTSAIAPGAPETADDGIDQDCSGADTITCFVDGDGDAFGSTETLAADGSCDAADDEAVVGGDCADGNPNRYPGNTEIPDDGVDQDCSGDDTVTCYTDADGDDFGVGTAQLVEADCGTLASVDGDCDDTEAASFPGNPEVVDDGIDQDCSGADTITCFVDGDGDSFGGVSTLAVDGSCDAVDDEVAVGGDCADGNPNRYPGNTEIPDDGVDQDCSGDDTVTCYTDADGDAFGVGTAQLVEADCGTLASVDGDCDDAEAASFPGNPEVVDDGVDQDCSGADTITCFVDGDGDSFGGVSTLAVDGSCDAADDEVSVGGDCADGNPNRYPGNTEIPDDGIDQDCSGDDTVTCYTDADGDDFGVGAAQLVEADCGALASVDGDCDDTEAASFPGNPEVVDDGIDQDCSGADTITCFVDGDGDSFGGVSTLAADGSCDAAEDEVAVGGDCADSNPNRYPGNPEILDDGVDQDCSGADTVSCYLDADDDSWGVGDVLPTEDVCGDFLASRLLDCDDGDDGAFPGNPEVVDDGIDQDCSGTDSVTCWFDGDGDGFGTVQTVVADNGVCDALDNRADNPDDCDDALATVNPDAEEIPYNGVDEDCVDGDLTDVDGDGVDGPSDPMDPLADCDDLDPEVYPGRAELFDGADNDCDGVCDEGFIQPGDLIVTEVMHDPGEASTNNGEWFEVLNTTGNDIVVCGGWTIEDEGIDELALSDFTFPAGAYVVFGTNGDPAVNGGVPVDYPYVRNELSLASGDELVLVHDGVTIDVVRWGGTFGSLGADGESGTLSVNHESATGNDDTDNWCDSTAPWPGSDGDLGSPGEADPTCTL
jgi:hypothetical protein